MISKSYAAIRLAKEMGIDELDIDRRKCFLELREEDTELLKTSTQSLAAFHSNIIDAFYEHVLAFDELLLIIPTTTSIERLKSSQLMYFRRLLSGQYDWQYVLERLQVGLAHERVGMGIQWYVGSYRKYLSELLRCLSRDDQYDKFHLTEVFDAILKIVSFDMALAIETYMYVRERKIINLEERLHDLVEGIDGVIWEKDATTMNYRYISGRAESLLGYSASRWLENPNFWKSIIYEQDREKVCMAMHNSIVHRTEYEVEYRVVAANREIVWINERVTFVNGHDGENALLRGLILDVRERKRIEEQLTFLATHDKLTGLANRNLLESRLSYAIDHADRTSAYPAILLLDLDDFKNVNDSMGHEHGDRLLQEVAKRIMNSVRGEDLTARLGGDEFCILLESGYEDYFPATIAERCLNALKTPIRFGARELYPRASIGIARYPQDGKTAQILLRSADAAMYAAKDTGKHRYAYYEQRMTIAAEKRLNLLHDLERAVIRNEFELYYQPQISLVTGRMEGVEALIRWCHPQRGQVPPNEFIPVAEETRLIIPINTWVINNVCRQIAEWRGVSVPVGKVAINLSGTHFKDDSLLETLEEAFVNTRIQASDLVVEVTEAVLQTSGESISTFEKLRNFGIKIAIDDFGTGYSCLASLTQLPIDLLKIDKSFVQNILNDIHASTIASTIISMGRTLGYSVLAEGVETIEQVHYLHGIGCNLLQGYYFSKPVPAECIPDLASTNYLDFQTRNTEKF